MNDGIIYYDSPFTGGKIRTTPESRRKARINHARFICERAMIRGFLSSYMDEARLACREAGISIKRGFRGLI